MAYLTWACTRDQRGAPLSRSCLGEGLVPEHGEQLQLFVAPVRGGPVSTSVGRLPLAPARAGDDPKPGTIFIVQPDIPAPLAVDLASLGSARPVLISRSGQQASQRCGGPYKSGPLQFLEDARHSVSAVVPAHP
jgi:hypothetical protein